MFSAMVLFGSVFHLLTILPAWATALSAALGAMAVGLVTVTAVRRSADEVVYDIIAAADADTVTGNIAHGMGVIPNVEFTQILSQALAAMSNWAVTTIDAVNIELTKLATVGSGAAGAQIRVYVRRPR